MARSEENKHVNLCVQSLPYQLGISNIQHGIFIRWLGGQCILSYFAEKCIDFDNMLLHKKSKGPPWLTPCSITSKSIKLL